MFRCHTKTSRFGYSLVELAVSLPTVAVLSIGMGSAVLMTARAIPQEGSTITAATETARAMERLERDLRSATEITARSATFVQCVVPDRTGDGQPDVIRYWWDGTAGQSLYRRVNNGHSETILSQVQQFSLAFQSTERITNVVTSQTTKHPTMLLASFDRWPGISSASETFSVDNQKWAASTFELPNSVPRNISKLQFTQVDVVASRGAILGGVNMGVYRITATGMPRTICVGSESPVDIKLLLSTYNWLEVPLAKDVFVTDGERRFAIVVRGALNSSTIQVRYQKSNDAPVRLFPTMRWSNDSKGNWKPSSDFHKQALEFRVYGYYETTSVTEVAEIKRHFQSVQVGLQSASNQSVLLDTTIGFLNQPEEN